MAVINGNEYDHIDISDGTTITRHLLKDSNARESIDHIDTKYGDTHDVVLNNMDKSNNLFFIHPDLLDVERDGLTFSRSADGNSYIINGTSTAGDSGDYTDIWLFGALNYDDSILQEGDYAFTFSDLVGISSITLTGSSGSRESSMSSIITESNRSALVHLSSDFHVFITIPKDKTFNNASFKCQIERGTRATEYKPHSKLIDYDARSRISKLENLEYPKLVGSFAVRCQSGFISDDLFTWFIPASVGVIVRHSINIRTGVHSGSTVSNADMIKLGNCNDIAYNPMTQQCYVATTLADAPVGVVAVGSYYSYVSGIVPVDGNGNTVVPVGITYDRLHDQYILFDDNAKFYVYDNSWTWLKTIVSDADTEPGGYQGIETDGYYLYRVRTDPSYTSDNPQVHIRTYLMNGHFIEEYTIAQLYDQEIEGLGYDWANEIFFIITNAKGTTMTRVYLVHPNSFPYHALNEIRYIFTR